MAVVASKSASVTAAIANSGLQSATKIAGKPGYAHDYATIANGDSSTSTYDLAIIPMNAKILDGFLQADTAITDASTIVADVGVKQLVYTGTPTADADLLIKAGNIKGGGRIAFGTGTSVAVAADLVEKEVWQHLGLATNPGGWAVIYATITGAVTTGGKLRTLALFGFEGQ